MLKYHYSWLPEVPLYTRAIYVCRDNNNINATYTRQLSMMRTPYTPLLPMMRLVVRESFVASTSARCSSLTDGARGGGDDDGEDGDGQLMVEYWCLMAVMMMMTDDEGGDDYHW